MKTLMKHMRRKITDRTTFNSMLINTARGDQVGLTNRAKEQGCLCVRFEILTVLRMKVFFIFSPDDGDSICWLAQTGMPIRFLVTRLTEDRTCQPISVRIQLHTAFSYCISHVTAHLVEMNNSYCNQYLGHVNNQKNMSNPKCFLFWCIHRMSQITFLFLYSCHLF